MTRKDYELNIKALDELSDFFASLKKDLILSGGISKAELLKYTGLSAYGLRSFERGIKSCYQLETIFRLAGYWELSDEQVVEIYEALRNKNKSLKIVDKNFMVKKREIVMNTEEFDNLSTFWYNRRKENGLTLTEVKEKTGLWSSDVSRMENCRMNISLNYNIMLCNLYGVTDNEIVSFYHKVFPRIATNKVNLDNLTKNELIEIILKQNEKTNNYYSKAKEKNKIKQKILR